jgi:hypothetical protein
MAVCQTIMIKKEEETETISPKHYCTVLAEDLTN